MINQACLNAQEAPTMEELSAKTANAVRTSSRPNIDGMLNDKVWDNSIPISDLIQFEIYKNIFRLIN